MDLLCWEEDSDLLSFWGVCGRVVCITVLNVAASDKLSVKLL